MRRRVVSLFGVPFLRPAPAGRGCPLTNSAIIQSIVRYPPRDRLGSSVSGPAAGRGGAAARPARGVAEVAEEIRIGLEQHARVIGTQARFVGLHRAVEREELGVLSKGFRKNPVALRIALAADLLALRLRLGEKNSHVAIRLRADLLRLLGAFRPKLLCLALALGLHALVDSLAVFRR